MTFRTRRIPHTNLYDRINIILVLNLSEFIKNFFTIKLAKNAESASVLLWQIGDYQVNSCLRDIIATLHSTHPTESDNLCHTVWLPHFLRQLQGKKSTKLILSYCDLAIVVLNIRAVLFFHFIFRLQESDGICLKVNVRFEFDFLLSRVKLGSRISTFSRRQTPSANHTPNPS